VPREHLETGGIPDTDMIMYLSLGFASPPVNTPVTTTPAASAIADQKIHRWSCEGNVPVDKVYNTKQTSMRQLSMGYSTATTCRIWAMQRSPQVLLAHWIHSTMIDATNATGAHVCSGDYLAAASFCSTLDQDDRPTAATLHIICIDATFFDPAYFRKPGGAYIKARSGGQHITHAPAMVPFLIPR
jgi:hypothetical protein